MECLNKVLIIGQHLTSRTEAVRDYLLKKSDDVLVIGLGSAFIEKKENNVSYYKDGKLKYKRAFKIGFLRKITPLSLTIALTFLFYILHIIVSLFIFRKKFDCYIGISHFSGLMGVVLKKFGICKKNIYYAIDYYKFDRSDNKIAQILPRMANFIGKIAVLYSDEVWDISSRIKDGREKFDNLKYDTYKDKHKIVPLGYSEKFFRNKDIENIDRHSIVYVGIVVQNQGLELILEVLPSLITFSPRINIKIIGTGPFLNDFKYKVDEEKMSSYFKFYGFIEDEEKMLNVVASSAVGISLWNNVDNRASNAYYGDPGKTKLYSVCGLPVIVDNLTVYSEIVAKYKAGIAIDYNKEALIDAIKKLFSDDIAYNEYKNNAIAVANNYCNAQKIFSNVLN